MGVKHLYLAYLSRPASDRVLYKLIRRHRCRVLLEIGMGLGERATRMIDVALSRSSEVEYIGVDLFEARGDEDGPGRSLKEMHRRLASSGAKVRLIPGDPHMALARSANQIGNVDLLVISDDIDPDAMDRAWFYVPRLLNEATQVMAEAESCDGELTVEPVDRRLIAELSNVATPARAA